MKVTNNRARTATVFYKVQGKMQKKRLRPFESLTVRDLTKASAVASSAVSDFTPSKLATFISSISYQVTGSTSGSTAITYTTIALPYDNGTTNTVAAIPTVSSMVGISSNQAKKGRFSLDYL